MTDEQHMEFTSEEIARQREIIANAFTAPPYEIVDGNLGVWLTEQAFRILVNRVHETDIQLIMTAVNTHEAALDTLAQQQAEIGRLREALAWYADEANYEIGIYDSEINANEAPPIWDDGGLKAREVLKGGAG